MWKEDSVHFCKVCSCSSWNIPIEFMYKMLLSPVIYCLWHMQLRIDLLFHIECYWWCKSNLPNTQPDVNFHNNMTFPYIIEFSELFVVLCSTYFWHRSWKMAFYLRLCMLVLLNIIHPLPQLFRWPFLTFLFSSCVQYDWSIGRHSGGWTLKLMRQR